jgi:hypothetical protein
MRQSLREVSHYKRDSVIAEGSDLGAVICVFNKIK